MSCQLGLCIFGIWQYTFSLMVCILYSFIMQYFPCREDRKLKPGKIKHILYMFEFMLFFYVHFLTLPPRSLPWYVHPGWESCPLRYPYYPGPIYITDSPFTLGFLKAEFLWYLLLTYRVCIILHGIYLWLLIFD